MHTEVMVFHPHLNRSVVNAAFMQRAAQLPNTTVRDMYSEYPDFHINTEREVQIAAQHERIVFQFPLYWYSAPALLKEWEDAILYTNSALFAGKELFLAVSAGGAFEDYSEHGKQTATMAQILLPYKLTAQYLSMSFAQPFVIHHAHHLSEAELLDAANQYAALLN